MIEHYSIVFHPSIICITFLEDCKNSLRLQTYDYASQNSLAHITIGEFKATKYQISGVIEYLKRFVKTQVPFTALFNELHCSSVTKCAVFLPSSEYKNRIHDLTKKVRATVPIQKLSHISKPHISIGRKLTDEQLSVANQLFSNKSLDFECCQLALRKFNPKRKQFEIVEIFTFTGKPDHSGFQQMSFDLGC